MAKAKQDELKFEQTDFDLFAALAAIDNKDYGWYNRLTDEQRRKFVPYMMLYWTSTVKGNGEIASYYLMSTDIAANKHMFHERITDHPELQWLMLCASSPGLGKQFHQWLPHLNAKIGSLKAAATRKEIEEYFEKIYRGQNREVINECAAEYTQIQNHQHRLAELFPELKHDDIVALGNITTSDEIKQYETELGYDN